MNSFILIDGVIFLDSAFAYSACAFCNAFKKHIKAPHGQTSCKGEPQTAGGKQIFKRSAL